MDSIAPLRLVAIGASAGGVEALTELFACLDPSLDAAYLVVLHIPPGIRSHLDAVLAHATRMPVSAARTGEAVRRGHVYVASADLHLTVVQGRILLTRDPVEGHVRPSIDVLFRSIAKEAGDRGVGVILSGTLADGIHGLALIKGVGGVVLVQDPATALHASMPRNAMESVPVDFSGSPQAIAAELRRRLAR
jgi:two-component system chemotaxis response regulator CheB